MVRDHIGPELQTMLNRIDERKAAEARRGIKAWLLAPDIPTYLALMRGEDVPLSTLNPEAVERYGLTA